MTDSDVAGHVHTMLEHERPDIRRAAIGRLAQTRHGRKPGVLEAYDLVVQWDESETARRAALRALEHHAPLRAVDAALLLLDGADRELEGRAAGGELRWQAVDTLRRVAEADPLPAVTRNAIRDTAIRRLERDPSRDVRLSAARLLGMFPEIETLRALIGALAQRDFGIVYEAEQSMRRLTGRSYGCDAALWEQWLATTSDPFAVPDEPVDGDGSSRQSWWWP